MKMLFYVDSVFPYGAAWSSRARSFAKLFMELGYDIHLISTYSFEKNTMPNQIYRYNGYSYQFLKNKVKKFDRIFNPALALKTIEEYININNIDIFFSTRCPDIFSELLKILRNKNIPIYMEQCEWFDKSTFKLGKFDPYYRKLNYHIQHRFKECDGIIAISSLLENHYKQQSTKVVRIPTILDINQIDYSLNVCEDKILRLVFAGNIEGQKELMLPIFKAIDKLGGLSSRIEFSILGPSEVKILENIGGDKELLARIKKSIKIHGRIQQKEVNSYLKMSDFMIYIRPKRRSSNAGFPTKFAESLSVGTPVITNMTSDIEKYLYDGINGYIVKEISEDYILEIFNKIFALNNEEYHQMRKHSRATSENFFDYKKYIDVVKDLFE